MGKAVDELANDKSNLKKNKIKFITIPNLPPIELLFRPLDKPYVFFESYKRPKFLTYDHHRKINLSSSLTSIASFTTFNTSSKFRVSWT